MKDLYLIRIYIEPIKDQDRKYRYNGHTNMVIP